MMKIEVWNKLTEASERTKDLVQRMHRLHSLDLDDFEVVLKMKHIRWDDLEDEEYLECDDPVIVRAVVSTLIDRTSRDLYRFARELQRLGADLTEKGEADDDD